MHEPRDLVGFTKKPGKRLGSYGSNQETTLYTCKGFAGNTQTARATRHPCVHITAQNTTHGHRDRHKKKHTIRTHIWPCRHAYNTHTFSKSTLSRSSLAILPAPFFRYCLLARLAASSASRCRRSSSCRFRSSSSRRSACQSSHVNTSRCTHQAHEPTMQIIEPPEGEDQHDKMQPIAQMKP